MSPLLQVFLFINVFIVGVVATIAIQHALAHFRQKDKKPVEQRLPKLPPAIRQQLLDEAEAKFRKQVDDSTAVLQKDIEKTAVDLSAQMTRIGGEIIATEMKRYRESLESLRKQTEATISQAQTGVAEHQTDISKRLEELRAQSEDKVKQELAAEKEHLAQQIDTKLADAVSSFLVETLQHNVDLGAQADYMVAMLDEHKEELAKEIRNEL